MGKSKTKIYKSYDSNILEALFIKYGVSKYYIRQSISGSVQGITPESIKKDYLIMEKANKDTVMILIQKTMNNES
ncbi:hypothetical protein SAMN05444671_4401 [Flavobacterium sp. CF108]|uniref:hypothetical protein n=1 Tax=unclassified Flavobacterium TaxID=196869 RepID=UPI0008BA554A|nr:MULTISPECIES: hypothetical protein [unclassified Flavobacterium]SEO62458.1 hypothetical protein SAMN04487978_3237 [Flavobacterium sp. fv08]SHH95722.1 hypothetical protein SAMN05444671_4401 [Flavobacterium sp. CF108]